MTVFGDKDPDPCIGLECGGGAIEQYGVGYFDAAGPHPKCYIPPEGLHFTVNGAGGWVGTMGPAGDMYRTMDLMTRFGCEHPNCICEEDSCACIHEDSRSNFSHYGNFKGPTKSDVCQQMGQCYGIDKINMGKSCCGECSNEAWNNQGDCEGEGACSDSAFNNNNTGCLAAGTCSDSSYTTEATCIEASNTWTSAGNTFTTAGNTWESDEYYTGFNLTLSQAECECRGGRWSTVCAPVPESEQHLMQMHADQNNPWSHVTDPVKTYNQHPYKEACDSCEAECPEKHINKDAQGTPTSRPQGGANWDIDPHCNAVGKFDAGVSSNIAANQRPPLPCCCDGDTPKCGYCPAKCHVWQGTTINTCGTPVLYGPNGNGWGYGVVIPFELELVCLRPPKVSSVEHRVGTPLAEGHGKKGWLRTPPDWGHWKLIVTVNRPNAGDALQFDMCEELTFENIDGKGDLKINDICGLTGAVDMEVEFDLDSNEVDIGCECSCPCSEQVTNISNVDSGKCDCSRCPDPLSKAECEAGNCDQQPQTDPPCCESTCIDPDAGACPAADAIWDALDPNARDADGNLTWPYCADLSELSTDSQGREKPNLKGMVEVRYADGRVEKCCEPCAAGAGGASADCGGQCVCSLQDCRTKPSSVCGQKALTYNNWEGHGAIRTPQIIPEDDCRPGSTPPCINHCEYGCGCLSEDEYSSPIKIEIKSYGEHTTPHRVVEEEITVNSGPGSGTDDNTQTYTINTLIGTTEPFPNIVPACTPIDEFCNLSNKYPITQGCKYTKFPSDKCLGITVGCSDPSLTAAGKDVCTAIPGNTWTDSGLPPADHRPGIREPNSVVLMQPDYGYQCQLKGGTGNGPGNWDFAPKNAGQCLSAHIDGSHWHLRPQGDDVTYGKPEYWAVHYDNWPVGGTTYGADWSPTDAECATHPRMDQYVASMVPETQSVITECNIFCEGWWEVVTDCFRAVVLGVCQADGIRGCVNDCYDERCQLEGNSPTHGGPPTAPVDCDDGGGAHLFQTCPEAALTQSPMPPLHNSNLFAHREDGSAMSWPGHFPFLYYHPPDLTFCPYGEYYPAIGCPTVPGAPFSGYFQGQIDTGDVMTDLGGQVLGNQLYYPGNINTQWTSCFGNQPEGCRCCYPCGHPAYDPLCRLSALVQGSICDVCWECQCSNTAGMDLGVVEFGTSVNDSNARAGLPDNLYEKAMGPANQIYDKDGCPTGCTDNWGTGTCQQVVQDGGNEVAGCGQFMQEMFDGTCWAPIYCPEGLIEFSKFGGGFCIEGDMCCDCLREKSGWLTPTTPKSRTNNQLGWGLGSPVFGVTKLFDSGTLAGPAWSPLKDHVCRLEPCGMGIGGETIVESPAGRQIVTANYPLLTSFTLMRGDTLTPAGPTIKIQDHQSMGPITGSTGAGVPIWIVTPLLDGQEKVGLNVGDWVYVGIMTDTKGYQIGSTVKGNTAANGQFYVGDIKGNTFSLWRNGAPVIGNGSFEGGQFEEFQEGDGHWFLHSHLDSGVNCLNRNNCAYDFAFYQNQNQLDNNSPGGTSPKVLPEALFIDCIEEAFAEWSNILENLWSPRVDFENTLTTKGGYWPDGPPPGSPQPDPPEVVRDPRRGIRFDSRDPFPGLNNAQPVPGDGGANSHQLRMRFVNLGFEPPTSNQVPSNKAIRYDVPEWKQYTNWPEVGTCFHYDGVTKEHTFENMGECINNGHCYRNGCSANDNRPSGIMLNSSNECEMQANPNYDVNLQAGINYTNPQSCVSASYGVCATHEKYAMVTRLKDDGTYESFQAVHWDNLTFQWRIDKRVVIPDVLTEECCKQIKNPATNEIGGHWIIAKGEWHTDYGNGMGIWDPGYGEIFPCVPTDPKCCNGVVQFDGSSCTDKNGSMFLTPTNDRPTGRCCKEKEKTGMCLGDYNNDGYFEELAGCDWDCCVRKFDKKGNPLNPEAGWCVDGADHNTVWWDSISCPNCGGRAGCESGTGGTGCTEQSPAFTLDNGSKQNGPVQFTPTQRELAVDIGGTDPSFPITFVYNGNNMGGTPTEEKPICSDPDTTVSEAPMFAAGDIIRLGSEYMRVTSVQQNTDTLSVTRGFDIDGNVAGDVGNNDNIPDPDLSSVKTAHSAGTKIDIWLRQGGQKASACRHIANCEDEDGNIICDANQGIGYYPIDNRSRYRDCIEASRLGPLPADGCGQDGGCWLEGDGSADSSVRGNPIGISTLYHQIDTFTTSITITEIDNTGSRFEPPRSTPDTAHGNSYIHKSADVALPEEFTLKTGDIIRIGKENMEVVSVTYGGAGFDPDVTGKCTIKVDACPGCPPPTPPGPGLFGAPSANVPECNFTTCAGDDVATKCGHFYWYSTDADGTRRNCAGEDLRGIDWEKGDIIALHQVIVKRAVGGTNAATHDKGKWIRKKYENILCDCHTCDNNIQGSSEQHKWENPTGGGTGKFAPPGSAWKPASWFPKFDWQENRWMGTPQKDVPFYGQTGGKCEGWPEENTCCPRIGQIRVGMINWWYALRERWAAQGKGQCFDCKTGVLVGGQIQYSANSVEIDGTCTKTETLPDGSQVTSDFRATQKECDDADCIFYSNNCRGYCGNGDLSTAGRIDPRTGWLDEEPGYTTLETCQANGHSWFSHSYFGYNNKEACENVGHCWDYREPPLTLASGNPFECGYMGGSPPNPNPQLQCVKKVEGGYVNCLPEAPFGAANNTISTDLQAEKKSWENHDLGGASCEGFRIFTGGEGNYSFSRAVTPGGSTNHLFGGRVQAATPGGGDPPDPSDQCVCITSGKEDISGDLYIDASVKWRPDWVDPNDKPGAYSIKRVLMKQIGHMLGLPESTGASGVRAGIMSPIFGPGDNAVKADDDLYRQLRVLYEPRWWGRHTSWQGKNDYWWSSGIWAGDF